jgi:aldehyde dehydrogenase (NAD+)
MIATPKSPTEVVEADVIAVRTSDLELLRSLCADDMELVSLRMAGIESGRMKGGDAIVAFYGQFLNEWGGADPHPGPLLVSGNTVAFELEAHHADRIDELADFFTIENGKITRLAVYSGPSRPR